MKIAYFLGALNRGGAETLILDICRQHANAPYDFVCIYRHDGNMSDEFKASGAPMVHVPKSRGFMSYLWHVRRTLLHEGITIVHSQTPSNTLILAIALLGTGIKIVTTFHGHFDNTPWLIRKIVYESSSKIICVSKQLKDYTEHLWRLPQNLKIEVVYNGIDFSKFVSSNVKLSFDIGYLTSGNEGRIKLCMVGNFVPGRSQQIVVKAIHYLKKNNITDFDFYFIGRRDNKDYIRYDNCVQYCKNYQLANVHFLGSRDDVPSLLQTMHGYVYSTEHDTFGISVIEALAAKLPIVVNDYEVMQEVCQLDLPKTSQAIRFFKTEDIADCADKMKMLMENISDKKSNLAMDCNQAAEAVRKKYSIEEHIKQIYSIYKRVNKKK